MKILCFALSLFLIVSCNGDDEKNNSSGTNTQLKDGPWVVSYLFIDNMNETNNLNSFVFDFKDNNELVGGNDIYSGAGSWHYKKENGEEEISIVFTETFPLGLLFGEWKVMTSGPSKVELVLEDELNGNIDFLTFIKA
jgi:hypothetical protein